MIYIHAEELYIDFRVVYDIETVTFHPLFSGLPV